MIVPRRARAGVSIIEAAALKRSGVLFLVQVQTCHGRRSARVRARILPGEFLVQTTAEPWPGPGRAVSVHHRDGAPDPGGVRVREGGIRSAAAACARRVVAASIGIGAVFGIGKVCRVVVAVARTALVVVRVFHLVPGLVCYGCMLCCIFW